MLLGMVRCACKLLNSRGGGFIAGYRMCWSNFKAGSRCLKLEVVVVCSPLFLCLLFLRIEYVSGAYLVKD